MHEYEFRLVVQQSESFLPFLRSLNFSPQKRVVHYIKPHFRLKEGTLETKRVESIQSVFHDNVWFKWIHSIETPFASWNRSTLKIFNHKVANYQHSTITEIRDYVQIDDRAQLYAFRDNECLYKLIFEWEYGNFKKPLKKFDGTKLLESLSKYKYIYDIMTQQKYLQNYGLPSYRLNENVGRKPVISASEIAEGKQYLYANKLDGIFGLVYSYSDKVKEKWEGYECSIHRGVTLGDGFVFAAEKMSKGRVVLLDVYQVRGHDTATFCRRSILCDFLPSLKLIDGYFVQTYVTDKNDLGQRCFFPESFETDGIIIHDTDTDEVFKYKTVVSIDLMHFEGYFNLPDDRRIKSLDRNLEDGIVYEISTKDGRVMRKRPDRFRGNSKIQIEKILSQGWNGPPIKKCKKKFKK